MMADLRQRSVGLRGGPVSLAGWLVSTTGRSLPASAAGMRRIASGWPRSVAPARLPSSTEADGRRTGPARDPLDIVTRSVVSFCGGYSTRSWFGDGEPDGSESGSCSNASCLRLHAIASGSACERSWTMRRTS